MAASCLAASGARGADIVTCQISDYSISLDLELKVEDEVAGRMRGELQIHHQKVRAERRRWTLEGRPPTQFWRSGRDLKIRVLLGRTAEDLVDLVIETQSRPGEAGRRSGEFRLNTAEGVRLSGRLDCLGD